MCVGGGGSEVGVLRKRYVRMCPCIVGMSVEIGVPVCVHARKHLATWKKLNAVHVMCM